MARVLVPPLGYLQHTSPLLSAQAEGHKVDAAREEEEEEDTLAAFFSILTSILSLGCQAN